MGIYVNQTGYLTEGLKKAAALVGGGFRVVDKGSKDVVFRGESVYWGFDESAGEDVFCMDFSELVVPGEYYLECGEGEVSCSFRIGEGVYKAVKNDCIRALFYQRCGCALEGEYAGIYEHPACHLDSAVLYEDGGKEVDMSGGWHDAGDYGRYVTPAAVTVAQLLYAFELFPEGFGDSLHIPESGNGVPDVLNECRYELEWLFKMQEASGGVYHKLTSERHANFVMPQEDGRLFLAFPVSSLATADFAAVMALASRVYGSFDREFADRAWGAAVKAWDWLERNPEMKGFVNPPGCNTGAYDDLSDLDERLWAAAEMVRNRKDEAYLSVLEELSARDLSKTDMGWVDVSGLAGLSVLFDGDNHAGAGVKEVFREAMLKEADACVERAQACGYGVAMETKDFGWGSNMVVTNRGIILLAAYLLTGRKVYEETALAQLHYLLGKNAAGYSYVTGHGENAFKNPHNRPTVAADVPVMPGWVSGGPNGKPCDEKAEWLVKPGTPPMKCYLDLWECYSLNEITIYWNSSAVFLMAFFDRQGTEASV